MHFMCVLYHEKVYHNGLCITIQDHLAELLLLLQLDIFVKILENSVLAESTLMKLNEAGHDLTIVAKQFYKYENVGS